jgi:hypothetical protein
MNKLLAVSVIISGTLAGSVSGQVVTPDARANLLDGLQNTLANTSQEAADYSELRTPFAPPKEEVVQEVTEEAAPVVRRARLGDSAALGIISDQFKPLGSLILGTRAVLQLSNGKTIKRGDTFSANISGYSYDVMIEEITEKGYTLKLGSAEVSKNFTSISGASR